MGKNAIKKSNSYFASINSNGKGIVITVLADSACPRGIAVRNSLELIVACSNVFTYKGIFLSFGVIGHFVAKLRLPCGAENSLFVTCYSIESLFGTTVILANAPLVMAMTESKSVLSGILVDLLGAIVTNKVKLTTLGTGSGIYLAGILVKTSSGICSSAGSTNAILISVTNSLTVCKAAYAGRSLCTGSLRVGMNTFVNVSAKVVLAVIIVTVPNHIPNGTRSDLGNILCLLVCINASEDNACRISRNIIVIDLCSSIVG